MLLITLKAFSVHFIAWEMQTIQCSGSYRCYINFKVNLICGWWKCVYVGCLADVSKILLI